MADISVEDITQLFSGCTFMYNGQPAYVKNVNGRNSIDIFYLKDGKRETVPFSFEHFKPVSSRLGFVNIINGVVYMARRPIRRFHVGLCMNNISLLQTQSHVDYSFYNCVDKLLKLNTIEIYNCIVGKYPTFKQCCARVKKEQAIMAFDKQFAIDSNGFIFYRQKAVGTFNLKEHKEIEEIEFNKGCEHLILLLKGNYEKGCGDFRPA